MTREEALVKIGSAVTLINDVAENYKDEVGRLGCSEEEIRVTPVEKMIISGAKILTEAIQFLECENTHEYIRKSLDLMLKTMGKLERSNKNGGNDDDIEVPF